MEIERKYLVKKIPLLDGLEKEEIEQGYLCRRPTLRIRHINDEYVFTYKGKKNAVLSDDGNAPLMNDEIERPLTKEAYEHLKGKTDGFLITKTRYRIPLASGLTAELDIFDGFLKGLYFVEVEFPDEKASLDFVPPDWFGRDVSPDGRYSNGYLSGLTETSQIPESQ